MATATVDQRKSDFQLIAYATRRDFKVFIPEFWSCVLGAGKFVHNWHVSLIADELQAMAVKVRKGEQKTHDLVINLCFGTSKSMLVSVLFQAWVWSWFPEARFLVATHTDSLGLDLSDRCRQVVTSEKYKACFPHVKVRVDKLAKEDWGNTLGGERKSCTVGGKTPTGRHSHFLLVDDAVDPQSVQSEAELETAKRFVTEVFPSRMVDKGVVPIILVMQRLHPRDPTAVMFEVARRVGTTPIRHICLPGELSDGAAPVSPPLEELRRRYGQHVYGEGLMDPVRLSPRVLADYRARLLSGYSGQVLQNPSLPGGGRFKPQWFTQFVRAAPYECMRVRAWDRSATANGGCWTAGVLMALAPDKRIYVEDCVHGQWEPNERNDIMVATAMRDRLKYGPRYEPVVLIEAERGSTGLESFQSMARRLLGFRVREAKTSGSKDVRAEPWADILAAMNVWFVDGGEHGGTGKASWDVSGFISEHMDFRPDLSSRRLGGVKDQVDSSAHSYAWLANHAPSGTARVFLFTDRRTGKVLMRMVSCAPDDLPSLVIEDHACLLVRVADPILVTGPAVEPIEPPQPAGLVKLVDALDLTFADIDPSEHQETWFDPIPGYGRRAEEVMLSRDQAKRLWKFLLQKRDPTWEVVVVCGEGRVPQSVAMGLAAGLGLNVTQAVYHYTPTDAAEEGNGKITVPPNQYAYDITKTCRSMVVA